jgi:hypothetical protein
MSSALSPATTNTFEFEIVARQKIEKLAISWYGIADKIIRAINQKQIELENLPYAKDNIESAFELLQKLQSFPKTLLTSKAISILGFCNKKPFSIAIVSSRTNSLRVEYLCLYPKLLILRTKGMGSRVIEHIKDYASKTNHPSISLYSVPSSIKFYENHGFSQQEWILRCKIETSPTPIAAAFKENPIPQERVFIAGKDLFGRIMEDIAEAKPKAGKSIIETLYSLRDVNIPKIVLAILDKQENFSAISIVNLEDPKTIQIEKIFKIYSKSKTNAQFTAFAEQLAKSSKREFIYQGS